MVYKWYILPIGGLYGTYHLLREPGNSIELLEDVEENTLLQKEDGLPVDVRIVSNHPPFYKPFIWPVCLGNNPILRGTNTITMVMNHLLHPGMILQV